MFFSKLEIKICWDGKIEKTSVKSQADEYQNKDENKKKSLLQLSVGMTEDIEVKISVFLLRKKKTIFKTVTCCGICVCV